MSKMVTLSIDEKTVTVTEGTLVIDAAREAGVNIPVFCYHPKLEQVGMCRMCLVEIGRPVIDRSTGEKRYNEDGTLMMKFAPNLETACTTPVLEGMQVITTSDKVKAARTEVLEFLLTSHPLDCPVCDKGGECPLQNLTMDFGPTQSRFVFDDKQHLAKRVHLGELILLDQERCIQCSRCVRFQEEIAGEPVIAFSSRGRKLKIITFSEPGFDSVFSGNTTDICPVGALTTADFRFGARSWEMEAVASICNHCPVGCNIVYNIRQEVTSNGKTVIKRVMPRQNENVNEIWICDKARFGYHYSEDQNRLRQPHIKKDGSLIPTDWDTAFELIIKRLGKNDIKLNAIVGGNLSNESLYSFQRLSRKLNGDAYLYTDMAGGNLTTKYGLTVGSNLKDLGAGTTIMVVASDLYQESPIWWLRIKQAAQRGAKLIIVNPRGTKLDKYASHIISYTYGEESQTVLDLIPGKERTNSTKGVESLITGADNLIIFYGSEGIGCEVSENLSKACAKLLHETSHFGKVNNGLVAVWQKANSQGAFEMGIDPITKSDNWENGSDVLWIAGADPVGDGAGISQSLKSTGFVIVNELFMTDTAKIADVVLPVAAVAEYEGTFTTGERIVQRFYKAIPSDTGMMPDYAVLNKIYNRLWKMKNEDTPQQIFSALSETCPSYTGLDYDRISQVADQTPVLSRDDLYFGGTSYENIQGTGCHLNAFPQDADDKDYDGILPSTQHEQQDGCINIVPITRLYDQGEMIAKSEMLQQRLAEPTLWTNRETAKKHGLQDGDWATIQINNNEYNLKIILESSVPDNFATIARSIGIPLSNSILVRIKQK